MLGKLIGAIVSAPVRLVNIPVKLTQKAAEAADEFMGGGSSMSYRAPRKNFLDGIADTIDETCQEAMGDDD